MARTPSLPPLRSSVRRDVLTGDASATSLPTLVRWRAIVPDIASVTTAGLFVLFTVALMGPALLHPNERLYGIGGDGPGAAAGIAGRLQGGVLSPRPSLLGAPFGQSGGDEAADLLWWSGGVLLAHVFSPIGATNAMVFLAFVVTAVAAFAFLRGQGLIVGAALLGATVYSFSPIRLAEAQEHYLLLDGFWLIAEGALLLHIHERRWWLTATGVGVVVGLSELDNPYLGYFGGLLAGAWLLCLAAQALFRRDWRAAWRVVAGSVLVLVVTAVVVLPTQLPLLRARPVAEGPVGVDTLVRSLGDIDRLSLRWWNFLLPSPDNPLLGPLGRGSFFRHLGVDTVSEQSTMIGYVALVLAIIGLVVALRRMQRREEALPLGDARSSLLALGLVCIGTGIAFGVPPSFQLGPLRLPTPPAFMHTWLPQIRTTSRIDLLIQLGIAILAAMGADHLLRLVSRRQVLTGALLVAVVLEYTNVPPWRYVALLPPPAIETWLATLSPSTAGTVVQYPIAASDMALTPVLEFYANTVHHHPLFNGVPVDSPADTLRRNLQDVLNPTVPSAWAALGVRTVTLDTSYFRPFFGNAGLAWTDAAGHGLALQLPTGLMQRYADSTSAGYAVTAPAASVVAGVGTGFGDAELGHDGRLWRWIGDQATIWLDDRSDHPVSTVLWTLAHDNGGDHTLAWSGYLPSPVSAGQAEQAVAITVTVDPGFQPVVLRASGVVGPLAGSGSATPVSVQLRSLEPEPVRPLQATFVQAGQPRWELSGASVDACAIQAGQPLSVALLWEVRHQTDADQTVFLHLLGPNGTMAVAGDALPNGGTVASSRAAPGSRLADVHTLRLPSDLAPGRYTLEAGLYNRATGTRLQTTEGNSAVDLGSVTVLSPSAGPPREACPW